MGKGGGIDSSLVQLHQRPKDGFGGLWRCGEAATRLFRVAFCLRRAEGAYLYTMAAVRSTGTSVAGKDHGRSEMKRLTSVPATTVAAKLDPANAMLCASRPNRSGR